jgi:hypothetical protein
MINNLKCLLVTSSYHANCRNNQFSSSTFSFFNEPETKFKGVGGKALS